MAQPQPPDNALITADAHLTVLQAGDRAVAVVEAIDRQVFEPWRSGPLKLMGVVAAVLFRGSPDE